MYLKVSISLSSIEDNSIIFSFSIPSIPVSYTHLKNYIASFNVAKITDTSDIAKLSYYKDLLSNVEKSTGTLKGCLLYTS